MTTTRIKAALGIQTGDILNTSYNSGPYLVKSIHGPFTHFEEVSGIVILDHPEISLTLATPNAQRTGASGWISNVRQVGDRWFSAMNDEILITRPEREPVLPVTLFDLIDSPDAVEELPMQEPYQLNPEVDYKAGSRRVFHCGSCNTDFNAVPTNKHWCKHDCGTEMVAKQIYYVEAPAPDDRRPYISYYVMTLNSYLYAPVPDYRKTKAKEAA